MSHDTHDPSALLARLAGARIQVIERCGFDLETPLRHGVEPLILRTEAWALYLTIDGGRGNLLAFELADVSPRALRGAEIRALGDDEDDAAVVAALAGPISRIDRLARAPGGGPPGFYQFCGVRLGLPGERSLYLGTHLRERVDTDDLCILWEDEIRADLRAIPIATP